MRAPLCLPQKLVLPSQSTWVYILEQKSRLLHIPSLSFHSSTIQARPTIVLSQLQLCRTSTKSGKIAMTVSKKNMMKIGATRRSATIIKTCTTQPNGMLTPLFYPVETLVCSLLRGLLFATAKVKLRKAQCKVFRS